MNSARIQVGEIEVAYDEVGGGTRLFLLVHGYTGFRSDFETQLPALAADSWCIAPDLRGHGDSSHTGRAESYTLEAAAEDVVGLLDALGVETCDLLGHSMGGMIALRAVLAHPERFASLVCMDTAPGPLAGIPLDTFKLAWKVAREQGMDVLQPLVQARAEEDPLRTGPDRRMEREWGAEKYWARQRARFCATDPEAYCEFGRLIVEQKSIEDRLGEIRCPTLVMVGAEDRAFLAPSETLAAKIPGARSAVIQDAGHQPQLENPQAWLSAIRSHLERARG